MLQSPFCLIGRVGNKVPESDDAVIIILRTGASLLVFFGNKNEYSCDELQ